MKRLIPILLAVLTLGACHKDAFTISGTLDNGANRTLYVEELTPDGPMFIDSVKTDSKGNFTFTYTAPYESFYNLHVNEYDYVVLIPQKGEHIKIKGSYDHFSMSYEVSGSPESSLLWQLQDYSNHGVERLQEIIAINEQNKSTLGEAEYEQAKLVTDSMYLDAYKEQQEYIIRFLTDNRGSLATIIALYKPFNNHPIIDPQHSMDWYQQVLEGLEEAKTENPHTIHFRNTVSYLMHQYPPANAQIVDIDLNQ